jgi:hypothetical protein
MTIQGYPVGYYMILVLSGIVIIIFFRVRHMVLDIHRARRGLQQFFTCHGKERWGPPVRVKEWQRNAIHHLIAQRETLDNDIWQKKNRRNNLAEMEKEEQNRLSELLISEINTKAGDDMEKSRFIEFEIARSKVKIEELKKNIQEKDESIHSMELAKQLVNTCLKSYSKGKNPRLPVQKYIRGLFFDLR